jgi:hypothetical protein
MSSLIILPVVGSKPPWPETKIHSPTERPGEYGPTVVGACSELIKVVMGESLLESGDGNGDALLRRVQPAN